MELPLYIADTPCVAYIDTEGNITHVMALDHQGPDNGPRKLSLTRELLRGITDYIEKVTQDAKHLHDDPELREGVSKDELDHIEEGTT